MEKKPEKSNATTKEIHPNVALQEEQRLSSYYRNRNLILAQSVFELTAEVLFLRQTIVDVTPTPADAPVEN